MQRIALTAELKAFQHQFDSEFIARSGVALGEGDASRPK